VGESRHAEDDKAIVNYVVSAYADLAYCADWYLEK